MPAEPCSDDYKKALEELVAALGWKTLTWYWSLEDGHAVKFQVHRGEPGKSSYSDWEDFIRYIERRIEE